MCDCMFQGTVDLLVSLPTCLDEEVGMSPRKAALEEIMRQVQSSQGTQENVEAAAPNRCNDEVRDQTRNALEKFRNSCFANGGEMKDDCCAKANFVSMLTECRDDPEFENAKQNVKTVLHMDICKPATVTSIKESDDTMDEVAEKEMERPKSFA